MSSFSLRAKILALCGLMAVFLLGVGSIGFYSAHKLSAQYGHVVEENYFATQKLAKMRFSVAELARTWMRLSRPTLSPEERTKNLELAQTQSAAFEEASKEYGSQSMDAVESQLHVDLKNAWADLQKTFELAKRLLGSKDPADKERLSALMSTELEEKKAVFDKAISKLFAFQAEESDDWSAKAKNTAQTSIWVVGLSVVTGLVLLLSTGALFAASLSKQLTRISESLFGGANEVAAAAQQISQTSESLSTGATEQAAALQETAASLEEMNSMVGKSSESAVKSQELATSSQEIAVRGKAAIQEMIESVGRINKSNDEIVKQIDESNAEISEIVKVINEIGNKTKVINDIVFQTKLLSFNASVEAARAGEHGKGFAVVAEEVGNLAQMSGNAAKEISAMLDGGIAKVEMTVRDTKTKVDKHVTAGRKEVESGAEVAKRCGDVLEEIVRSVAQVAMTNGEIASASKEQAHGVQEISRAMEQLDTVTQQNSASAQESASAAEELSSQAETLRDLVDNLVRTIQGDAASKSTGSTLSSAASLRKASASKQAQPRVASQTNNVVKFSSRSTTSLSQVARPVKRVSGSDVSPAHSDTRFPNE